MQKRYKKRKKNTKKEHNEKPKTFPYLGVKCIVTVTVMSNENGMQHTQKHNHDFKYVIIIMMIIPIPIII